MQQTPEQTQQNPLCKPSKALISLLTGYEKTQINDAFHDMEKMYKDWLDSPFADDRTYRTDMLFSLQIISEIGVVIKSIPKKKLKQLKKELDFELQAIKDSLQ